MLDKLIMSLTQEENKALDWWNPSTEHFKERMFFKYRKMFAYTYAEPPKQWEDLMLDDVLRIYQTETQPIESKQIFKMFSDALMVKDGIWEEYCYSCKKLHHFMIRKCNFCNFHSYKQPLISEGERACKTHYPCTCEQKTF